MLIATTKAGGVGCNPSEGMAYYGGVRWHLMQELIIICFSALYPTVDMCIGVHVQPNR